MTNPLYDPYTEARNQVHELANGPYRGHPAVEALWKEWPEIGARIWPLCRPTHDPTLADIDTVRTVFKMIKATCEEVKADT